MAGRQRAAASTGSSVNGQQLADLPAAGRRVNSGGVNSGGVNSGGVNSGGVNSVNGQRRQRAAAGGGVNGRRRGGGR
ncbi:hypothetical protein GCM10009827_064950 [Dactylosporangium maewongense]|uniref:Uncharacterized protein n=1 Tax=Dactylosporangium maewongense TaxID=634393 RepID=A0ABP4M4T0_9ACTN